MRFIFYVILAVLPTWIKAQNNLIIRTPVSASPGGYNTFLGIGTGLNASPGGFGVFVGHNAGLNNTGSGNSFLGSSSGQANTTGYSNTFLGSSAGSSNISGSDNTFIGQQSALYNTTGSSNTFIGSYSGNFNRNGSYNVFIGLNAGLLNASASANTFVGERAGANNTVGKVNVFVGSKAGYSGSGQSSGSYNVFLGDSTGYANRADGNVFIGSKAGYTNQTGQKSTFIGYRSGYNAVADSNTFIGYLAGYNNTTGSGNIFLGVNAGSTNSTGSHNTIVGNKAGPTSIDSDDNVYIGYNAGKQDKGYRNTFLGTQSGVLLASNSGPLCNATAVGAGATVSVSNALVLGNQANVGIGTSAPTARLEVVSETPDASGLKLTKLTLSSKPTIATDQFLTVNEQGDVVKGKYRLSISDATEWSDKVFTPNYVLRPLVSVAKYIQRQHHLPDVPSAEQVTREGVDLAKLNAILLAKIEELTLYSIQLEKTNQRQNNELRAMKKTYHHELHDVRKKQVELERLISELLKRK